MVLRFKQRTSLCVCVPAKLADGSRCCKELTDTHTHTPSHLAEESVKRTSEEEEAGRMNEAEGESAAHTFRFVLRC